MELIESKYAKAYKQEIEKMFSKSEADMLWKNAEAIFHKLIEENPNQSQAAAKHTYVSIFPTIAIYKTVLEKYPDKAIKILENGTAAISQKAGSRYARIVRLPGFKSIFMKAFSKGVKSGFGTEAGFSHEFITDSDKCLVYNITRCPYRDYCEKYGCSEIVRIFCKNDEYAYGNLPGIRFTRTQTLGTGGNCCDFKLER